MAAPTPPVENQIKKRNDAYTGFLAISFLAMAGGAVLLWLEYQNYENKPLPKTPVIEVPGVPGKAVPNSGGAPKVEPKPPDDPAKGMMRRQKPNDLAPALLRADDERTQIISPADSRAEKIFAIPEVPPTSTVIQASASEIVIPAQPQPAAAGREPELTDAPPIPIKRFSPPK